MNEWMIQRCFVLRESRRAFQCAVLTAFPPTLITFQARLMKIYRAMHGLTLRSNSSKVILIYQKSCLTFLYLVRWRIDDPWAAMCVMADDRDAAHVLVISTVLALSCCLDSFLVYYHTCPSWKRKKAERILVCTLQAGAVFWFTHETNQS
jgi:hypothetical protein